MGSQTLLFVAGSLAGESGGGSGSRRGCGAGDGTAGRAGRECDTAALPERVPEQAPESSQARFIPPPEKSGRRPRPPFQGKRPEKRGDAAKPWQRRRGFAGPDGRRARNGPQPNRAPGLLARSVRGRDPGSGVQVSPARAGGAKERPSAAPPSGLEARGAGTEAVAATRGWGIGGPWQERPRSIGKREKGAALQGRAAIRSETRSERPGRDSGRLLRGDRRLGQRPGSTRKALAAMTELGASFVRSGPTAAGRGRASERRRGRRLARDRGRALGRDPAGGGRGRAEGWLPPGRSEELRRKKPGAEPFSGTASDISTQTAEGAPQRRVRAPIAGLSSASRSAGRIPAVRLDKAKASRGAGRKNFRKGSSGEQNPRKNRSQEENPE